MELDKKTEEEKKIERNEYRKKLGKPVNPEVIGTENDPQVPNKPLEEDDLTQ